MNLELGKSLTQKIQETKRQERERMEVGAGVAKRERERQTERT